MIHAKKLAIRLSAATALSVLMAHQAIAAGTIESFCLASGGSTDECSCSQTVADEHLSTADQKRFVTIANDPAAFAALGSSGADGEAFLQRVTAFSEALDKKCQ